MERIKELRDELGLSQLQVSLAIGISQESISSYERGKTYPKADHLMALADFFQVSTDYLLGRSDIRDPKIATLTRLTAFQQELLLRADRIKSENKKQTLLTLASDLSE